MSIPGIGARTGARILTEIGDITRFPTAGQLAAYAGLAPVTRQSGSSINGETRSRRGNHRLKNAMWLSAFCSLHHDRSRDYYARKRSQGKLHNAAITCLARRRCDVIHAMLRTGLSYGELPAPPLKVGIHEGGRLAFAAPSPRSANEGYAFKSSERSRERAGTGRPRGRLPGGTTGSPPRSAGRGRWPSPPRDSASC
jgi:hypothetical protein